MKISRRTLLGAASGLVAGVAPVGELLAAAEGPMPARTLGRTGVKVPLIGFGMAPLGSERTSAAEAETIVRGAIDLGFTYLDVSPDYGAAEPTLTAPRKRNRERIFPVPQVN